MSFDMGALMKQASEMQSKMEAMQEQLAASRIEGQAGGGRVKCVVNGMQELQSLTIAPEIVDPSDIGMLQDLIQVAVNDAVRKSQALAQSEMEKISGGMNINKLMGGLGGL